MTQTRSLRRLALLLALAAGVLLLRAAPEASGAPNERFSEEGYEGVERAAGELIVAYNYGASVPAVERANEERGARTLEEIPQINARVLAFPEIKALESREERLRALEEMKRLYEQDPLVDVVDYNYRHRTTQESGADYGGEPWGLQKIEAPAAWQVTDGAGATVAIVDTGIDASHPEFAGKLVAQRDFANDDAVAEDTVGHGTHVAGIAAASGGNIGTCPGCGIIAAKVTEAGGVAFDSALAEGIVWSADMGADAINVSLVSRGYSRVVERAVEYAWNRGSLVVSAAGNEGTETPMYPSAYGTAISVAATDRNDERPWFSNYGDWVDVAAPGRQILSTTPGGTYATLDGTSMATAYVTGLAGLLAAQGLAAPDIRHRIEFTATDLGAPGKDPYYGWGLINARAATGTLAPQPEISAVNAPLATPGERLSFSVEGSGFQEGARVLLVNGSDLLAARTVEVSSPESLEASFFIPRRAAGTAWDLVVVNPDGQRAGYLGAVRVSEAQQTAGRLNRSPGRTHQLPERRKKDWRETAPGLGAAEIATRSTMTR